MWSSTSDLTFIQDIIGTTAEASSVRQLLEESVADAELARLYAAREYDLLAVGRALVTVPDWATKTLNGQRDQIKPYTKESESIFY